MQEKGGHTQKEANADVTFLAGDTFMIPLEDAMVQFKSHSYSRKHQNRDYSGGPLAKTLHSLGLTAHQELDPTCCS